MATTQNNSAVNLHGGSGVDLETELKSLTYIQQYGTNAIKVSVPGKPPKVFYRNKYKTGQEQVSDAIAYRDSILKKALDQTDYPKLIAMMKSTTRHIRFGSLGEQVNFARLFSQRLSIGQVYGGLLEMFKRLPTAHAGLIKPGEMYFYEYDAKFKHKMDYWDGLPLIFVINRYPDGFLGLNLHYLAPLQRQAILMAFLQSANRNKFNQLKRMRLDYVISLQLAGEALIKPMVHRYLYTQIRSPIKIVPHDMWVETVFLPIAKWNKNV